MAQLVAGEDERRQTVAARGGDARGARQVGVELLEGLSLFQTVVVRERVARQLLPGSAGYLGHERRGEVQWIVALALAEPLRVRVEPAVRVPRPPPRGVG